MENVTSNQNVFKVSEVELIYKSKVKASERPKVGSVDDAYQIFITFWNRDKLELIEQFKVMLLNRAQKVLGIYELSSGGITGTVADPKLIFAAALKAAACSIIVAHCHPSGNLTPSNQDKSLTHKLVQAGELLDIHVLDHLIITSENYLSFRNEGLI